MNVEEKLKNIVNSKGLSFDDKKELLKELLILFEEFRLRTYKEAGLNLLEILQDYPDMMNSEDERILTSEFCEYFNLDLKKLEDELNHG